MKVYIVTDNYGLDYECDETIVIRVYGTKEKAIDYIRNRLGNNFRKLSEDDTIWYQSQIDAENQYHYDSDWDYSFLGIYETEMEL